MDIRKPRRTFIKTIATTGILGGITGTVTADDDTVTTDDNSPITGPGGGGGSAPSWYSDPPEWVDYLIWIDNPSNGEFKYSFTVAFTGTASRNWNTDSNGVISTNDNASASPGALTFNVEYSSSDDRSDVDYWALGDEHGYSADDEVFNEYLSYGITHDEYHPTSI